MAAVAVLMGVSGSGKSRWVAGQPGFQRVTFDAIKKPGVPAGLIVGTMRKRARKLVGSGASVAADACNLRKGDRSWWASLADEFGASTLLVVVHPPPLDVLLSRQSERGVSAVPNDVVRRQFRQWPSALSEARREGWDRFVEVDAPVSVAAGYATTSREW